MKNANENKIMYFKDEGDFYVTKLTEDGQIPNHNELYPYGSLVQKTFRSRKECRAFAESMNVEYEFD